MTTPISERNGLARLLDDEVRLGHTRFWFRRLNFNQSTELFEAIRYEMQSAPDVLAPILTGGIDGDGDAGAFGMAILKLILGLRPEFVARVRRDIFKSVLYATDRNPQATPLPGDEEEAFEGLSVFHMYEVLARALAVNFFERYREWQSQWNGEDGQPTI